MRKDRRHSDDMEIIFEDRWLIVVDKPSGLLSMSTGKSGEDTAYSRVYDYAGKVFIIHRLDRDTSGLMVYAKDVQTQQSLIDGWQQLVTDRRYIALVQGTLEQKEGKIQSWLTEDKRFVTHSSPVDNGGKFAVTYYKVLQEGGGYSLVECELQTGRKNQIRVHMADLGHPVVGDHK